MAAKTWEEEFDFFLTHVADEQGQSTPVAILLDLNAGPHVPLASHPLRLRVRTWMKQPRADGLRSREESEDLFRLEDALLERLVPDLNAIYVGRMMFKGLVDLVLYAPPDTVGQTLQIEQALAEAAGPYDVDYLLEDDPSWDLYREFLSPGPLELQCLLNRRQVEHRAQLGDDLDAPRDLDHLAVFPSRELAAEAARQLAAAGFDVSDPSPQDGEVRSIEPAWDLPFRRRDALGSGHIDHVVADILDIIAHFDGVYDGWGGPILRAGGDGELT